MSKSKTRHLFLSIVSVLSCLGGQIIYASQNALPASNIDNIQEFKLQPRLNAWGYTGDTTFTKGQFLMPLYGDQARAMYVLAEGNYVKNGGSWMGGSGLGYRQVANDHIYGGYAVADYFSSPHNGFTVINPGIEMLGNVWDFNINGYIPLNNRKRLAEEGSAGETFGDYSNVHAYGHNLDDSYLQKYEEVGRGAGIEVARIVPYFEDAKIHLEAFHFDTKNAGSNNGIKTRLTYELNRYTGLEIANQYDDTNHNKFTVGVHFVLGGYSKEEKKHFGVATRLLDPIERSGTVIKAKLFDTGTRRVHDNIQYFKPATDKQPNAGVVGDGTAENPFIGFTPDNVNAIGSPVSIIDKHPLLYFRPGEYSFKGFKPIIGSGDRFDLKSGWGMYGRTYDYKAPATGDDRAKFIGGLNLNYGTAENEPIMLDSIRLHNGMGDIGNAALYVSNAKNVMIKNSEIINDYTIGNSEVIGIYTDSSTINFTGGNNNISGTSTNGEGYGIQIVNSTINFTGGNNNISGTSTSTNGFGIQIVNSTINFTGGNNTISGNGSYSTYGIYANSASTINFTGGINNISGNSNKGSSWGIGAYGASTINFIGGNNQISGNANNNVYGSAYGIYADSSIINLIGGTNTISGNGINFSDYGIYADNASTINFTGGNNNISGNGSNYAYGISLNGSIIKFANSASNKVNINANGNNTQYGIYAMNSSKIEDANGNPITQVSEILNYTMINLLGPATTSEKILIW